MLVILDSTEIVGDPFLKNVAFTVLQSLVSRRIIKLVVPTIVVEEAINNYRKRLEEVVRAVVPLKRLLPVLAEQFPEIDVPSSIHSYSQMLLARLEELGAQQADYHEISLDGLVARALRGRKPFDSNGQRGFRDAIIWETSLQQVKVHQCNAILVTRNKADFGEDDSLAKDLADDLVDRGLPPGCIRISDGIVKCIDRQLKSGREAIALEEAIQRGVSERFNAIDFFKSEKGGILAELNRSIEDNPEAEILFRRLRVVEMDELPRFEVCGIWSITDERLIMHIDYIVNSRVEYEKFQAGWNLSWSEFEILVNMIVVFDPSTHELLDQGVSEFQFWPNNVGDASEVEYLSR